MKLAELERKLLAAARLAPGECAVPAGFERRVMARLAAAQTADPWTDVARLLWRAVAPALGLTLLLGALTFSAGALPDPSPLDSEIESAVYAGIETNTDSW